MSRGPSRRKPPRGWPECLLCDLAAMPGQGSREVGKGGRGGLGVAGDGESSGGGGGEALVGGEDVPP